MISCWPSCWRFSMPSGFDRTRHPTSLRELVRSTSIGTGRSTVAQASGRRTPTRPVTGHRNDRAWRRPIRATPVTRLPRRRQFSSAKQCSWHNWIASRTAGRKFRARHSLGRTSRLHNVLPARFETSAQGHSGLSRFHRRGKHRCRPVCSGAIFWQDRWFSRSLSRPNADRATLRSVAYSRTSPQHPWRGSLAIPGTASGLCAAWRPVRLSGR
jgi:hypothetical protein